MKRIFKQVIVFVVLIVTSYILLSFFLPFSDYNRQNAIEAQVHYLDKMLKDQRYDLDVQNRYPEGKIFANVIFGLSVIEHFESLPYGKKNAASILDGCLDRLLEKSTIAIFHQELDPEFGVFYCGWMGLLSQQFIKSSLLQYSSNQRGWQDVYEINMKRIGMAQSDSIRSLESYRGQVWPADNLVAIASLYDVELQSNWLETLQNESGSPLGLLPHSYPFTTEIRGSSQMLMNYMLGEIDSKLAREQYHKIDSLLIDRFLMVDLVHEFTSGDRNGDYDSGPLVFGYGAVATVMHVKCQARIKSQRAMWNYGFLNVLGLPIYWRGNKYYLFGQEPMYDIFMLWCAVDL